MVLYSSSNLSLLVSSTSSLSFFLFSFLFLCFKISSSNFGPVLFIRLIAASTRRSSTSLTFPRSYKKISTNVELETILLLKSSPTNSIFPNNFSSQIAFFSALTVSYYLFSGSKNYSKVYFA